MTINNEEQAFDHLMALSPRPRTIWLAALDYAEAQAQLGSDDEGLALLATAQAKPEPTSTAPTLRHSYETMRDIESALKSVEFKPWGIGSRSKDATAFALRLLDLVRTRIASQSLDDTDDICRIARNRCDYGPDSVNPETFIYSFSAYQLLRFVADIREIVAKEM